MKRITSMKFLTNGFERVGYLVKLLTARATGMGADSNEYPVLELLSSAQ